MGVFIMGKPRAPAHQRKTFMGISLLAAFKAVPWTDVLAAAPTIVQSAEKLWGTVLRKKNDLQPEADPVEHPAPSETLTLAGLDSRQQLLENRIGDLQAEAVASSELIKSLAEQNAQLVRAVDILRQRTRLLLRWCAVLTLAAALGAVALLLR